MALESAITDVTKAEWDRFWSHVEKRQDGCWAWTACKVRGYGHFGFRQKRLQAHRFTYRALIGDIPGGHHVDHLCRNPGCVNPAHLFAGTATDNVHDMEKKGRRKNAPLIGSMHCMAKLSESDIPKIKERIKNGESQSAIAKDFGVARTIISRIKLGQLWKHV